MQRDGQAIAIFYKCFGHFHRANAIHIGGDDRYAFEFLPAPFEDEFAGNVDVFTTRERWAFRPNQHVFKIKFYVFFNAHGWSLWFKNASRRGYRGVFLLNVFLGARDLFV